MSNLLLVVTPLIHHDDGCATQVAIGRTKEAHKEHGQKIIFKNNPLHTAAYRYDNEGPAQRKLENVILVQTSW